MKHQFKVAMTALAICFATNTFAAESAPELQSETTLAQELNLSTAQVEQIKSLREKAAKELGSVKLDAIGQDVIINMIKTGKWDEAAMRARGQALQRAALLLWARPATQPAADAVFTALAGR